MALQVEDREDFGGVEQFEAHQIKPCDLRAGDTVVTETETNTWSFKVVEQPLPDGQLLGTLETQTSIQGRDGEPQQLDVKKMIGIYALHNWPSTPTDRPAYSIPEIKQHPDDVQTYRWVLPTSRAISTIVLRTAKD